MSTGEIILYRTEDGLVKINLRAIKGTVWLIQEEIAELFGKGCSTISEHISNILGDGELVENLVCRNFRRTARDGKDCNARGYELKQNHRLRRWMPYFWGSSEQPLVDQLITKISNLCYNALYKIKRGLV